MPKQGQPLQWPDHIATHLPMPAYHYRSVRLSLSLALCAGLLACGSFDGAGTRIFNVVQPYRVPLVQGNFVSKEQVAALQPGMSRQQVKEILGTPLVVSVFHTDRWDFVFTLRRQGVESQSRRLTVYFKGDALDRFEGDEMPSETEFVAQLDGRNRSTKVPRLEASEAELDKFPVPQRTGSTPASESVAPPTPQNYPPLESGAR
jgi:outer membrane protein assembly factor BamE